MSNKLYVGNLSFNVTQNDLEDHFASMGTVQSCKLITDRDTGRSKGFAFVEMDSPEEAQSCIDSMDGQDFQGRSVRVNIAQDRPSGGGGGGGGGGGRGGFGGGGQTERKRPPIEE